MGILSATPPDRRTGSDDELLTEMISIADAAMCVAKRLSGNQIWHCENDYGDGVSA